MKTPGSQYAKNIPVLFLSSITCFLLLFNLLLLLAIVTRTNYLLFHVLLMFTGWFAWTFSEYCQHRFHSHAGAPKQQSGRRGRHLHHHQYPNQISITGWQRVILLVLCILMAAVALYMDNYFSLLTGYLLGFTGYTFMHWFLHKKISARVFPRLHRFHVCHHCRYPDKCFGVSVTWWDDLFGTVPPGTKKIPERILNFYYRKTAENGPSPESSFPTGQPDTKVCRN